MLTALLRWMNQSRKEQRKNFFNTSRQHQSPEALFRFACDSCVPHPLRQLWQGKLSSRTLFLEAFEDRVLFSAAPAPAPAPVEVVVVAPLQDATATPVEAPLNSPEADASATATDATGILASVPGSADSAQSATATLVVVDPSVPDYESLLDLLVQQSTGSMEVLVLDSQRDGLEQIAERLEQLGQTRAIHILSHGDEAGLHLGSNWLSADTIAMRASTLHQWHGYLTPDADILFYGCDLAANATGQAFLQTFGELTGADVAASTNATGATDLGGDWQLEYQFGSIETQSLGEQMRLFDWEGVLTTNTYQHGAGGYSSAMDNYISAAFPDTLSGSLTTVIVGGPASSTGMLLFGNLFGNGAGQIPLGSTITSASLRLNVTTGTAVDSTIALHRILTPTWNNLSTWNNLGDGLPRDGVDVAIVADALVSGTTTTGVKTVTGIEESLQAWSNGAVNNGWALFGDNATDWAFTTLDGATVSQRPMLIVDFIPPATPVVALLNSNEVRVNSTTTNVQSTVVSARSSHDAVGVAADGRYVVVWTSDPGDGSGTGVYAQRYNARNVPIGNEFLVNSQTIDNQRWASVAMKSDGGFIVTWTSQNQDGDGQGVYAKIYSAAGVGGSEFRVNTTTTGAQQSPAIGVAADGSFVIAWEGNGSGDGYGIFAQRFNATGTKLGSEIRINSVAANDQFDPAIAVGQDGQFMVVWDDSIGTQGRRFNANGTAKDAGDLLLHADYTSGNADVTTSGTGDYHVVWRTSGNGDGSGRGIWRMSLDATQNAPGTAYLVTTSTINDQTEPSIASDVNGDYIVVWQGAGPGDTNGVFGRKFTRADVALGAEFQLNQTTAGTQFGVSAAMLNLGNFITIWSGAGSGDADGVFSRTFGQLTDTSLQFTTWGNVNSSGSPGLNSWTTGEVIGIGDPNLNFGTATSGTLFVQGNLAALGDGNIKIDGLDVVRHDVVVGSGLNSFQVRKGDVLFSVAGNETFGLLSVQRDDIVVFRPDEIGSYKSGQFFMLYDGVESVAGGSIKTMADFDLIETDTQVGDVVLSAGDLVVTDIGPGDNSLVILRASSVGSGTTVGTVSVLLKGSEFSNGKNIAGIQVVEGPLNMGNVTLREGELLVSADVSATFGTNSISVGSYDVARLFVTTTSVNGPANVTAELFVEGNDIQLNGGGESIRTLALSVSDVAPKAIDDIYSLNANQSFDTNSTWFNTNWSSRTQLTFDNSSRAEDLTDFPVLVSLDSTRFDYSLAKNNGADLRFVDANGTVLDYEIETWNPNGRSAIWVKVPQIDASSATDSIWMYYGNAAAADAQNAAAVWSNGYAGVWHLNNNPGGAQSIQDSTSNNKDGTTINMDASNKIDGPIGGALSFDGTSEAIRIASTAADSLAINGNQLTIEAWANSTGDQGTWESLVNRQSIGPLNTYALLTKDTDQSLPVYSSGISYTDGTTGSVPNDRWRYYTGVSSGTAATIYVDGVQNATRAVSGNINGGDHDVTLGAGENGTGSTLSQYWQGGIDEIRISNVARSAAWVSAQYASMTDTLVSFGTRQTVAGLLSNDSSATAGGLTITQVDTSSLSGFADVVVQDNGRVILTPGAGALALPAGQVVTKDITYTVIDSLGGSSQATAHFVFTGVNSAPTVTTNIGLTLLEGGNGLVNNTRLNASDPNNTPAQLVYTVSTAPANGRLERVSGPGVAITTFTQADLNSGAIRYVHNGSETTSDSFGFSLSDGGAIVTGSFAITVTPVNDAPVINTNFGRTTTEGGTAVVNSTFLSATDVDNTASQLIYSVSTAPVNGRLERVASPGNSITTFTQADLDGGAIRYVHNGGETTSDSFAFSLSDGAATVTGSFAIIVTPVNDAPVIVTNVGVSLAEGGNAEITSAKLSATDADNTSSQLVYTISTAPTNGRVERVTTPGTAITSFTQAELNSSAIRYVHNGGETTSDTFAFSLSDGAATVTGSFAIIVTPVNDAPVIATNTGRTVTEGGTTNITSTRLAATDADNTPAQLVYTVTTIPANGRLERTSVPGTAITTFTQADLNSSAIRYVHNGSETTSDSFSFSLSDGTATVTGSFAITVTPVNDAPEIGNFQMTIAEGQTLTLSTVQLLTNDNDTAPTAIIYTVTSVTNGHFETVTNPGTTVTTFSQDDVSNSRVVFIHNGGEAAPTATLSVNDGNTTVGPTSLSITFNNVNDPPTISTNSGLTLSEGATATIGNDNLGSSDPDNTAAQRVFTVTTGPTQGQLEVSTTPGLAITSFTQAQLNSGIIRYVHAGGESPSDSFSFTLSDGTASVTGTFALAITTVNDAPVLTTNSGVTLAEGGVAILSSDQLAASDADNEPSQLVYTVSTTTVNGRLERVATPGAAITTFTQAELNSNAIRYVHNGGETTSDSFGFSLSDSAATLNGSFAITITPVNDAPAITTNVALIVSEGGAVSLSSSHLNTLDADNEPAGLTYTVTGGLGFGHLALASAASTPITVFTQAQINGNQVVYVHDGSESTADYFTFSVSDGALSATGTMSITVTAVNDAPLFEAFRMTLAEGQTVTLSNFNLLTNDPDTSPTALVYTVNSVTNGQFESVSAPGVAITSFSQDDVTQSRVVFVHDGGEAVPTATLTVTDGLTSVGPNSMLMTFSNVNDPTTITTNTGVTLNEGATATIGSVHLNTSDPDDTPAQRVFTVTTGPAHGQLEMANNAGVTITSFTQADIDAELIRYVHDGGETTSDGFSFSISSDVTTVNGTFAISVMAVNDPPTLTASAITVSEGQTVTLTLANLNATDVDSENLTFNVTGVSRGQFRNSSTGQSVTSFTLAQVQAGQIRFRHNGSENAPTASVSVSDGVSSTTPVAITFTFTNVNDPPVALADTIAPSISSEIVLSPSILLANDSDAEHDPLTISITRQPNHGTLVTNLDGTFTYRPELGYSGTDSFEYVVSDGIASSAAAVVSLNVSAVTPSASNSTSSASLGSHSSSTASAATSGDAGTTSQALSGSTSPPTSGSLIAPSPDRSFSGTNSSNSEEGVFAFNSHTHDEEGLGLFLARQRNGIDEVTQRARTSQGFEFTRPNSRSGEVALEAWDSLLSDGLWSQSIDPTSSSLTQFRTILASDANLAAFADVTQSLRSNLSNELIFEIPALAGASLTVGYVVWMLRGGLLITSLLAQVPAWSIVDPLAVLDSLDKRDEDDESIGSLVEQGQSELEPVM